MHVDRRTFLAALGGVAAIAATPGRVRAEDRTWHVLYPGTTTREEAEEHLAQIAGVLGPQVARNLTIARVGDVYVPVYDRSGVRDPASRVMADQVASRHDALLRAGLEEDRLHAEVVGGLDLQQVWNIRYGEPGDREALQAAWQSVARMLGAGVSKKLVIQELDDGRAQLVYQRMGDRDGTEEVARHHHALLRSTGLSAAPVPDAFHAVVFDGASAAAGQALAEADAHAARAAAPAGDDTSDTGEVLQAKQVNTALRDLINDHVQQLRRAGRVSSVERTAWVVHDLHADERLAHINADLSLQAASMIKPFVAVAFFHLVQTGRLVYGPRSTFHMERMIQVSSNSSTNWVMRAAGGPAGVQAILRKHYPDLSRGLKLVEYIPSNGRTYRNLASANDHAALLRALWFDELPRSAELKRVMNLPGADRIYRDVPDIPVGTEVYNKTGSTAMCCGDMGVLVARTREGRKVPYIVVGVIDRRDRTGSYTSWVRSRGDVIRQVSGLTYRWLRDRYDLA